MCHCGPHSPWVARAGLEQAVGGLDVAVHDAERVQVAQAPRNLQKRQQHGLRGTRVCTHTAEAMTQQPSEWEAVAPALSKSRPVWLCDE